MSREPADRRKGWTPQPRPEWVRRINEEGSYLDLRGVIPLDANSLLATATQNTGLSDFGTDDWYEPFQVLVQSLDNEAELHLIGRIMARGELLMFLEGRLWIEDTYKKHPEIEDEQIVKPLMIMGQGRSGTTGMHHLLASDPANRAPMTWEVLLPYPPPEKATFDRDPRIEKAVNRFNLWNRVTPEIVAMHDFSGALATENIHIQCLCFQSPLWLNMLGQIPSYNAYMEKRSLVPAYEYEKRVLKYLQWKNPGDRWVHKTPAYTDTMPAALEVFPDAQFIWMHRDPVKALSSMVSTAGTINWARSDRAFIGGDVQGQFGDLESFTSAHVSAARLNAAIDRLEAGVPPKRQLCNVQYVDFVKDPLKTVEQIYAYFSIPIKEASFAAMRRHIEERARERRSRQPYVYEMGTPEQIAKERELYRRYQTYFSVADEV
ncbi:MAG: sulfotransferase [Steroidobacteraceae bacterium]